MPRRKESMAQEMARFGDKRTGNLLTNIFSNIPLLSEIAKTFRGRK